MSELDEGATAGGGAGPVGGAWRLSPSDREQPAGRVFALVLGDLLERFAAHEPGVRQALDPEELHQLRISLRRARSVLAAGAQILPAEEAQLLDALMREFARLTSPVRDLDVALAALPSLIDGLGPVAAAGSDPLRGELERRRTAANDALVAALDGDVRRVLVRRWRALSAVQMIGGSEPGPRRLHPAGDVVDDLLVHDVRRVRRRGRRALESGDLAEWHRLRKRLKRLRYLAAELQGLYPQRSLRRVLRDLARLQDALGVLQDHAAQTELVAAAGRSVGGDGALTAGALVARLEVGSETALASSVEAWERWERTRPVRRVRAAVAAAGTALAAADR